MKRLIDATLTAVLAALLLPAGVFGENKIIYGEDNRLDQFEAPAARKTLAASVVSLWKAGDVEASGSKFKLKTVKFTDMIQEQAGAPLCATEPFREQPVGAFCSGSLVGEDLVMTAGHCITSEDKCKDTKLVFGFAVKARGGKAPAEVSASDVYSCAKIETQRLQASDTTGNPYLDQLLGKISDQDFAIIRLDRKVTGRKALAVNPESTLKNGDALFVIGHPVGLPLKVADDASVRDIGDGKTYFLANLDTYGGNSGSAVFNARTNKVEGILVRGDQDFRAGGTEETPCVESNRVAQDGGGGEGVTKINQDILAVLTIKSGGAAATGAVPVEEAPVRDTAPILDRFGLEFE
ncbi:MAG: V8-like Glu-specific endopeptidase [Elusimicrobia bacterium]|nr:MAG: V8-like Glu-specific endopeptidase [Elusimicrobiota bacterium]KAF0156755.1 MAG: V8-like Glu-specific endopeptidase [Elusimicrobiota bacterium]